MRLHRCCGLLFATMTAGLCVGQNVTAHPAPAGPAKGSSATNVIDCGAFAANDASLNLVFKLCEFALTYRQQLPDFIVQQTTTARGEHSTTVMTAQVVFRSGQESYSHFAINGKPVESVRAAPMPQSVRFTSAGEFGSLLLDLFAVPGATEFRFHKTAALRGIRVAIYDFHIAEKKNSFWTLRDGVGRVCRPEFRGQLWLDERTGHPLREEVETVHLPADFLIDSDRTTTDYASTHVADLGTFLLPVKSETTLCTRPGDGKSVQCCTSDATTVSCSTNILVFHDYQKFVATTRILP